MSEQRNHCHPSVDLKPALSLKLWCKAHACVRVARNLFTEPNPTGSRPGDLLGLCRYACRKFSATWHGILIRVGVARMFATAFTWKHFRASGTRIPLEDPTPMILPGDITVHVEDERDSRREDGGGWEVCLCPAVRIACERLFVELGL